jgi:hypothetical protein
MRCYIKIVQKIHFRTQKEMKEFVQKDLLAHGWPSSKVDFLIKTHNLFLAEDDKSTTYELFDII